MPLVIETFAEFDLRHGGQPLEIAGRLLWPDGAMSDMEEGKVRYEPPSEPLAALRLRRRYVAEQLRRAEREFHETQSQFAQMAQLASQYANLPPPPHNAREILEHLKSIVERHRAALLEMDEQLNDTPAVHQRRIAEEAASARRAELAQLQSTINEVFI